jgi:hypothetical protein
MTGEPLHIAPAPRIYTSRKDRSAIVVATVVSLVGAAALALAIYLYAQSHVERPELHWGLGTTPSVEKQAEPKASATGGKAYTDRLPGGEEAVITVADGGLQGPVGKSFTERVPDGDEANKVADRRQAETAQGKRITDRVVGDIEVTGD